MHYISWSHEFIQKSIFHMYSIGRSNCFIRIFPQNDKDFFILNVNILFHVLYWDKLKRGKMNQCKWARQQRWDFSFLFCFSCVAVAGPPLIIDIFEKFCQTDEKDGPAWFIFGGEERQTRTDFLLLWLLWVKGGSRSVQMQGFLVHNTPCCFSSSSSILTSSYIQEKQT